MCNTEVIQNKQMTGDFYMDILFNTKSFMIDEHSNNQIEKIKKYLLIENKMEASLSDAIRYSINFTEANVNKCNLNWEEVMELTKDYVITAFITEFREDLNILDRLLDAIDRVNNEIDTEEVKEIASICNNRLENVGLDNNEPMTIGRLVRFKHRIMPTIFLNNMGIDEEQFMNLNDNELADFILMKFQEEDFKENAKSRFNIQS